MSLSQKVKEELLEAQSHLKNALSSAARNESPLVIKSISDLIYNIDNIEKTQNLIEKLESRKFGDSGKFGTFFDFE
jgi:DNA-binding transcriptional regulator WhiA